MPTSRLLSILTVLLYALCLAVPASAAVKWGRLYTITADIVVRGEPSETGAQTRVLKSGQKVRIDPRDDTWATVYEAHQQERSEDRAIGYAKLSDFRDRGIVEVMRKTGALSTIEVRRIEAAAESKVEEAKPAAEPAKKPEEPQPASERKAKKAEEPRPAVERKARKAEEPKPAAETKAKPPEEAKPAPEHKAKRPEEAKPAVEAKAKKAEEPRQVVERKTKKSEEAKPAAEPKGRKQDKADKPEKTPEAKKAEGRKHAPAEFGELRVADRRLAVRADRSKDSTLRKVLHSGQKVRVDFQDNGWFAVFDPAEKTRDLSRAWGFARDKFLLAEAESPGAQKEPAKAEPAKPEAKSAKAEPAKAAKPEPVKAEPAKAAKPEPAKADRTSKTDKADENITVGYSVLERRSEKRGKTAKGKSAPPVATLRVRLDLAKTPAKDMLRKIMREIWKAERKKGEDLRLEVLLRGMDAHGLAYATASFHEDGRIREFWWRDVVLGKDGK
jgi:hypothetical protein